MKAKLLYLIPGWTIDSHINLLEEYAMTYDLTVFLILEHRSDKYKFSIGWLNRFALDKGLDIRIYRKPYRIRDLRNLLFLFRMFKKARPGDFDLVYSEAGDDLYAAFLSLLFLRKKNTIQGIHNASFHSNHNSLLMKLPHLLVRRWFAHFRLYSLEQERIFRQKYPRAKTYVSRIPQWTEHKYQGHRTKKESTLFLFAGHIYPYKGVDLLIAAASRLAKKYEHFKVAIAGSCADWKRYEAMIKDPSLFELDIAFISEDKILAYFQKADFLVLPYRDVTQSGILTLGYSVGLPAIVSDCPGFLEYVRDRVDGCLFKTGDVDSLAEAMEYAICLDAKGYEKMVDELETFTREALSAKSVAGLNKTFMNGLIGPGHGPRPSGKRRADPALKPEIR